MGGTVALVPAVGLFPKWKRSADALARGFLRGDFLAAKRHRNRMLEPTDDVQPLAPKWAWARHEAATRRTRPFVDAGDPIAVAIARSG